MSKHYQPALEKARHDLQGLDPIVAATLSGATYRRISPHSGQFEVRFWDRDYRVSYPEGQVEEVGTGQVPAIPICLILLHYLITAEGKSLSDRWVAFRELPDGRVFDLAFRQRALLPLAQRYGQDVKGFVRVAEELGGERLTFGDASFMFRLLPRLRMAVVLHLGDEEFPPAANILYDAAAGNYLPTEDLAVLGEIVSHRLIRAKEGRKLWQD